ncbi:MULTISPECIES: hypothetical protein [unclassified Streptomyces]|uniref:hypothetical protein n=1 Tax=unclassified Streptomyces TaxID=2593676 RepID=UPI0022B68720|nr:MULTISPECIES: hypothetical protein [unclassified Streptomyces]MCZ7417178.1 hypothetical protein [Streptomyces sp. WMMC897]MCZ7432993.1 hypothetical protein [Streptomyces sp. WMMC1477]
MSRSDGGVFRRFRRPRTDPYARRARSVRPGRFELLVEELPEDDLGSDAREALDLYVTGSKPECEEEEFLALLDSADDDPGEGARYRLPGPRRHPGGGPRPALLRRRRR